jgi:hypothetical protein
MKSNRRMDHAILSLIESLALEGHTAAQVEQELNHQKVPPAQQPSRRTIQRIVQEARITDQSGPWSLGDSTAEEAALVLPVLRAYLNLTSLRQVEKPRDLFITRAEARWIAKIARVAPGLHVVDVYRLARAYLARESRGLPTYDLDALLAFEPWDQALRVTSSGVEYTTSATYQKGIREGWIPPAPAFLMRELAGVPWVAQPKDEHDVYVRATYLHDPQAFEDAAVDLGVRPEPTPAERSAREERDG